MRLTKKIKNDYYLVCEIDASNGKPNAKEHANKLGQLEDIEDDLGIDLITLSAVLDNGFWHKSFYYKGCYDYYSTDEYDLCFDKKRKAIIVIGTRDARFQSLNLFALKDYGKIWALTKEELE